jgi:hypothetical protein
VLGEPADMRTALSHGNRRNGVVEADRHDTHLVERLTLIAATALAVVLVVVWAAGQLAGGLWHGAWPAVPLQDSLAELGQLTQHPGDPIAPGVPGGAAYMTVLSLLVILIGTVALKVLRWVGLRPRVYWAPPRGVSRSSHQPFIRVYRASRGRRW